MSVLQSLLPNGDDTVGARGVLSWALPGLQKEQGQSIDSEEMDPSTKLSGSIASANREPSGSRSSSGSLRPGSTSCRGAFPALTPPPWPPSLITTESFPPRDTSAAVPRPRGRGPGSPSFTRDSFPASRESRPRLALVPSRRPGLSCAAAGRLAPAAGGTRRGKRALVGVWSLASLMHVFVAASASGAINFSCTCVRHHR